ncbi:MAG: hypothetical protein AMR96_07205 [Candidatus Adiutrix intracellularis]|nr:MAG: hypothetical protein AMR96_07205 [Candidatus Adiutrix intracellularis]
MVGTAGWSELFLRLDFLATLMLPLVIRQGLLGISPNFTLILLVSIFNRFFCGCSYPSGFILNLAGRLLIFLVLSSKIWLFPSFLFFLVKYLFLALPVELRF